MDGIRKKVDTVSAEKSIPYPQNCGDGIRKKVKQNNTENSTNNKAENNTASEKEIPPSSDFDLFVKELCVVFESFTVISSCIRCQITNNVIDPIFKPVIYGHVRWCKGVMFIFILCIIQPVPCFLNGFKILILAFAELIYISRTV